MWVQKSGWWATISLNPSTLDRVKITHLVDTGRQCSEQQTHLVPDGWRLDRHAAGGKCLTGAKNGALFVARRSPAHLFSRHCGLPTEASPTLILSTSELRRAALGSLLSTITSIGTGVFEPFLPVVADQGTKERMRPHGQQNPSSSEVGQFSVNGGPEKRYKKHCHCRARLTRWVLSKVI